MRRAWLAALLLLPSLAANVSAQNASTPEAPPPNPPPATTPSTPTPPSAPAANLETLAAPDARTILGTKVSGAAGEDMGLVVDVLFNANKEPSAVVIDFGGFLGVGTRKIAVDWHLLHFFAPDSKTPLMLALSRADVQNAPEYKPGAKTISVIAGPALTAPAATTPAPPPIPAPLTSPVPSPPATDTP